MIYKRYVDDIFILFLFNKHLQPFANYINKQHKCLKFTSEAKKANSFSFLGIKITRHNQQFKTSVYRKPLFSGAFTRYQSCLDQTYKESITESLLSRCFSICTDYTLFHLEVENLREIFKKNSYPSGIIEQSIKSFLNKLHVPKKVIPTVPKTELFIVLPYLGTKSSNSNQKLRTCFKNSLPQCNIKIILKSTNCVSLLIRFKDVIPKELQSHTVYKCLCGNWNVTYYGKTEHQLNLTPREDIAILHLTGKSRFKPSAVSNHLLLHNHDSDFNDFTILRRGNNGFRLLLKEFIISSSEI